MLRDWSIAVLVGVAVFFAVDWLSKASDPRGEVAPAFSLPNAAGGTIALADYAGKPVVLNFWGTWCPPCRHEIPAFARWSAENPEVPILGIAQGSGSGAKLLREAKELGVTWPVAEADTAVISAYGVSVFPTTVVVGADGKIVGAAYGELDEGGLDKLVASALLVD
jgi:peroxiredoxin